MTTFHVIRHRDWNPKDDQFKFSDKPFKNPSGGLNIGFFCNDNKLRVKTPKMRVPFGLQAGMDGKGFNLQLSFDESDESKSFLAKCEQFDEIIEQAGLDHAADWFVKSKNGKPPTDAVIKEKFSPMVKSPPEGKDYQPTFRVKLPSKKMAVADPNNPTSKEGKIEVEAFQCRLFNHKKESIEITDDSLKANSYVSVLMVCTSIWSTTTGFGASWKAEQIMVFQNEKDNLPDYCLPDMNSDEETEQHMPVMVDDDDTPATPTPPVAKTAPVVAKPDQTVAKNVPVVAKTVAGVSATAPAPTVSTPAPAPAPVASVPATKASVADPDAESEEVMDPDADEEGSAEPEVESTPPAPEPEPEPVRKPTVRARKPAVAVAVKK